MSDARSGGKRLRAFYQLTKPGIIYGNLVTAAAGFLFASRWHIAWRLATATLGGMALVIAAACVCNNFIDRGIDKRMARTRKRALVHGDISGRSALLFAGVLLTLGFATLGLWTNALVVWIGVVAFVDYVALYGWGKRASVHGTIIGSVSGSAPLVAGYVAVRGHFDLNAFILFLIMTFWQMPHFYAIATYRFEDYKAAGLPVLPVARGVPAAKRQIVLYIVAFALANAALSVFGAAGVVYAAVMATLSGVWLARGLQQSTDHAAWAKRMFLFSLVVMLGMSGMLAVAPLLP